MRFDWALSRKTRILVRKIKEDARIPEKQTPGAGAFDVYSLLEKPVVLKPGERTLVPTGLAVEIPEGFILSVRPRSGLAANHGITLVNSPGTIDSDYRGEVMIPVINLGENEFILENHQRIAQVILEKTWDAEWIQTHTLSSTNRGEKGFGSTGKH